jgi:hypothetical protein
MSQGREIDREEVTSIRPRYGEASRPYDVEGPWYRKV